MSTVVINGAEIIVTPTGRAILLEMLDHGHMESINCHPAARGRLPAGGLVKAMQGGHHRIGLTLTGLMVSEQLRAES